MSLKIAASAGNGRGPWAGVSHGRDGHGQPPRPAADSADRDTDIAIELGRIGVRHGRAGGPWPVTDIMIDSEVGSNLSGVQV